jgi:hypothetical protein
VNDEERGKAIGNLVWEFYARYKPAEEPTDDVTDAWWEAFAQVPLPVLYAARDDYFAHEEFMPRGGGFRAYVSKHSMIARRSAPVTGGSCPHCDHGWVESSEQETAMTSQGTTTYSRGVLPCAHCRPDERTRWRDTWIPENRRNRPIRPDDLMDYNPTEKVAEVKALLRDAGALTKNASHL